MTVLEKPADTGGAAGPAAPAPPAGPKKRGTGPLLTAGLVLALLVLVPVAGALGAYPIPVGDVLSSVQHRIGLGGGELDRVAESVL